MKTLSHRLIHFSRAIACLLIAGALLVVVGASSAQPFLDGKFAWQSSGPLVDVAPGKDLPNPHVSIKDPTFVHHEGRWHLFATLRMRTGKVDMVYMIFTDWADANRAPRHLLNLHDQYNCAPQVFYFTPHKKWYLVFQMADQTQTPPFGPCFSTTANLADPKSWTKPRMMVTNAPAKPKWLDFWVICDREKAHLFYTSLDGQMWRRETKLADFPFGWGEQTLALKADIFEASHTYKLKDREQFLTIIEAQGGGGRYYKAYLAKTLAGPWEPLAATWNQPFASRNNVKQATNWTASISHGELIRAGVDERMEVDPADLRMIFQGASDAEYRGNPYGQIPWRMGLLTSEK